MAFLDDTGVASLVAKIKAKIDALNVVNTVAGKTGNVTLEASDIASGTFDDARIPYLAASKIMSGTFSAARLPNATTSSKGGVIVGSGLSVSSGTLSAPVMTGATSSANGTSGITPAPIMGESYHLLLGNGLWVLPGGYLSFTETSGEIKAGVMPVFKSSAGTQYQSAKMSYSGKTVRKKLWENASPSSSFGAQTITLSEDVENYLFWTIECYLSTSVQDKIVSFVVVGRNGLRLSFAGSGSNSNRGNSRDMEIDSTGTELTFSANYYNNTSTNANLIPFKVFGFFHK